MCVSTIIFIISVISSTESEGCESLQNSLHGNTEYKSQSPSRSALLKSFVSTYIFIISMIGQRRDSVGLLSRYGQRSLWMEVSQWYMNMGDWLKGGPVCENGGQYFQESWLGYLLIVLG